MTQTDEEYLGDIVFFDLVAFGGLWPKASLAQMSKSSPNPGPYETEMIRRFETAWTTPFQQLTCEQVRLLLSQQAGLEWLARPILEFVQRYPDATVTNYSGEMVLLCLYAASEFVATAGGDFAAWVSSDFGWMEHAFGWDKSLLRKARAALDNARSVAACH